MNATVTAAVLLACLATGVIYGTDVFCAVVLRPAAAGARETSIADLVGRIHHYGDRRLPIPGSQPSSPSRSHWWPPRTRRHAQRSGSPSRRCSPGW